MPEAFWKSGSPDPVKEKQALAQVFGAIGYGDDGLGRPHPPMHVDEYGRPLLHEMFPEQFLRESSEAREASRKVWRFFGIKIRW